VKLEYFENGYRGQDLLLLYSGSEVEVENLRAAVRKLIASGTSLALHDLDFIESVDACKVTASSIASGGGVRALVAPRTFAWELVPSDWERVEGLLEPFCQSPPAGSRAKFQYLHEHGGTEVIYSTAREW